MKKALRFNLIEAGIVLSLYLILLYQLAGSNIIAGIFCPGPHLPPLYPVLIILFVLCRIYLILLPGILLSRLGVAWVKRHRTAERQRPR